MASALPAAAVDPMNFGQAEVFSLEDDVNSLGIDYLTLIDDIHGWIQIATNPDGVLDSMSTYLIDSFQTLLKGSIHANLTTIDISKIKKMLKVKLRPALDKMLKMKNEQDNAKYTSFCSTFLGVMSGTEARGILEVLDPDPQCDATVDAKKFCWICGNPLRWESVREEAKPQCEHILPISDALFHLNLYQNRSSISTLGRYDLGILKLEYLWAHACCNLSKQNLKYITTRADGKYEVYNAGITETIERIERNFDTFDCKVIFKSKGGPTYKGLTLGRIRKYIEPIVKTINNHIAYIAQIGTGINKQKAYIVYEYLIMIRFFSRIPKNTLVRAFKKYYLEGDPDFEAEQIRLADERIKAEEADAKKQAEARMERELAALARQQARIQKEQQKEKKKRNEEAARKAMYGTRESRAAARAAAATAAQGEMEKIKSVVDTLKGSVIATADDDTAFLEHITTAEDIPVAATEGGASGKDYSQKDWDRIASEFIQQFPNSKSAEQKKARNDRVRARSIIQTWISTGTKAVRELADDIFSELDLHHIHQLDAMSELEESHQAIDLHYAQQLEVELARLRQIEYHIGMEEKRDASAQGGARLKGGENKNIDDPYAIIQADFTTEKAFVFLLAYQPIYLQRNKLTSITADKYMSTPHILRDTLAYFGIDPAEYRTLLMNDSHGASVSIPQSKQQNFTALYASLKNPRPITPFRPIVQHETPLRQGMVSAGKRRTKKRNVIKRRTRKHKKI
jgi:hypothetical protein